MHIVSLGYAEEPTYPEKRAAKEFFNGMQYLLPCPECRGHFREVLTALPVETWLDNRKSLVEWVWMVHNQVNQRLGKPTLTQDEFFKRYSTMADRGLPIPPAAPTAEIHDSTMTQAYIRGATHATGVIVGVAALGALLWLSYKQQK